MRSSSHWRSRRRARTGRAAPPWWRPRRRPRSRKQQQLRLLPSEGLPTATAEARQTLCQGEIDAEMKREQWMLANLKFIGHLVLRNLPAVKVIGKGEIDAKMRKRE